MNINDLMRQAQKMQAKMSEAQDKVAAMEVEGTSGGGLVTVNLTGKREMKGLKISPSLVDPAEIEVLEDLIIAAYNDASHKLEEKTAEEMSKVTGGMPLPGGLKLPF